MDNKIPLLGSYYEMQNDHQNMEKYCKENKDYQNMEIDMGDADEMRQLAMHYDYIGDYSNMEKYYLMAMDRGCLKARLSLESYYYSIGEHSKMAEYHINRYKQRQLQNKSKPNEMKLTKLAELNRKTTKNEYKPLKQNKDYNNRNLLIW